MSFKKISSYIYLCVCVCVCVTSIFKCKYLIYIYIFFFKDLEHMDEEGEDEEYLGNPYLVEDWKTNKIRSIELFLCVSSNRCSYFFSSSD